MKIITVFFSFFSFCCFAQNIHSDPAQLTNHSERERYLTSLYQLNQRIHFYEDSVMHAAGWKSDLHLAAIDSLATVQKLLANKVDAYLQTNGYPSRKEFEEPTLSSPIVILGQSSNSEFKRQHFPILYKAYKRKDIEERRLVVYLEKLYETENGRNFQSFHGGEERLLKLIEVLELRKIKTTTNALFNNQ